MKRGESHKGKWTDGRTDGRTELQHPGYATILHKSELAIRFTPNASCVSPRPAPSHDALLQYQQKRMRCGLVSSAFIQRKKLVNPASLCRPANLKRSR
mmetsp:Transcript_34447/g.55747  ORF Transcript_34447/g.55747 Transcript_34447/m.55747 type:complete len:98 (+) Transcript_34447:596-889(+)